MLEAKEIIQEDDNKIIVNYKKTKSEDEHDHKLDFEKVQEKINMKHISQEINIFTGDSCIKTVKKYISNNELNTEVKYHNIYHILSKKVKTFKEQDAQAFINKLNQDDFQYLCDCIKINSNENRLQYIIFA